MSPIVALLRPPAMSALTPQLEEKPTSVRELLKPRLGRGLINAQPKLSGRSRHGAPDRRTQKIPFRTRRSFTRGTPRGLLGGIGLMAVYSSSVSSWHGSAPSVRA